MHPAIPRRGPGPDIGPLAAAPRPALGSRLVSAVALLILALPVLFSVPLAHAQEFPKFTGFVVDTANAIPPAEESALVAKLDAFQQATKRQLVVVTLPYDANRNIEDYGYRLGRTWGVGLRDVNNGAILLAVPYGPVGHRDVRIEVGYGLEPVLTDAYSSVIINSVIIPTFKAGDIPGGLAKGADAIIEQLSLPDSEAKTRLDAAVKEFDRTHARRQSDGSGSGLIFWGIVAAFVLLSMLRGRGGRRGRRYGGSNWPIVLWGIANAMESSSRGRRSGWGGGGWGGGSSGGGGGWGGGGWGGGGFSGGGGGGFGGGGASGSW